MKRFTKQMKTRHRKQLNETNDCSVIAIAIVCRTTYKRAHSMLQVQGRKNRHGSWQSQQHPTVERLGLTLEKVKLDRQKNGSKFTPKTIGDKLKRGYYLCYVNSHVFAVVNGEVEDWTKNRKHHITDIYKVVRKRY